MRVTFECSDPAESVAHLANRAHRAKEAMVNIARSTGQPSPLCELSYNGIVIALDATPAETVEAFYAEAS